MLTSADWPANRPVVEKCETSRKVRAYQSTAGRFSGRAGGTVGLKVVIVPTKVRQDLILGGHLLWLRVSFSARGRIIGDPVMLELARRGEGLQPGLAASDPELVARHQPFGWRNVQAADRDLGL